MLKPDKYFQKSISAAYTLLGSIFFGGLCGYFLYNKYDNNILFIICLMFGVIVGMYELYKQIK